MHNINRSIVVTALLNAAIASPAVAQETEYFWDLAVTGADTVFMEEMTTGQIAAALRNGTTTAIVPSGGLEQNGPNLATGKHNYIVRPMANSIARKLGNTLVTATVKFVPEGEFDPPSGHMRYPGTISVRTATYEALLADICRSLKTAGFTEVVLLGDSGGGQQESMAAVAEELSDEWAEQGVRVVHIVEFYADDAGSFSFIESELGIQQNPVSDIHSSYYYEAVMAVTDPQLVHAEYRMANNSFVVRDVAIGSVEKLVANGHKLINYRSNIAVDAIRSGR